MLSLFIHSLSIAGNKTELSLFKASLAIAGNRGGLSLFINAEQYHYMRSYKISAGLHVLISDHSDSKALIEKKALSASTGYHTTMAFNAIKVITLILILLSVPEDERMCNVL